ncbi:helix-turn-helix domain-containing protein [Uliginosibacterium gangwonense]|uniref:helix-turn-helix domain-containing protein n=1 Tax=Uliginosibacterium gangwonense TaxID=392736 RepID=UPI00036263F1|nr:AraC family transcriptional regulator [Uliginosibacterium gangwonense]
MPQASSPPTHRFWRHKALAFAQSRCARDSTACYAPHTHTAFSIGAVDGGSSVFSHGLHKQRLERGDVVFIPAGEVHACNPENAAAWCYQMLYLDENWLEQVVGELAQLDAIALTQAGGDKPPQQIHAGLTALNACLFGATTLADKEAALVCFAAETFSPAQALYAAADSSIKPPRLEAVKTLILDRCSEHLPLETLAETAGMSRYHFIRAFQRSVGMTPHAWQLDARINRARALLEQGMPLAQIALTLGFADQAHFQRAFKQRVAVTPNQYRRNILQYPAS